MKSVVLTGVETGIGKALCLKLLQNGYSVLGCHYQEIDDSQEYEKAAQENAAFKLFKLDVRDEGSIDEAVLLAKELFPELSALINVAGVAYLGNPITTTNEQWEESLEVNITGYFKMTRAFLPLLQASKYPHIINMSSIWGVRGNENLIAYSTSKFAVEGYTKGLQEFGKKNGIKVSSIVLDKVNTNFRDNIKHIVQIPEEKCKTMIKSSDVVDSVMYILSSSENVQVSSISLDAFLWED